MLNTTQLAGLYNEIHKAIDQSAATLSQLNTDRPTYPPGIELTEEEQAALKAITLSPVAKSALYKLCRDACSYPVFHFFSLLDGVTDPSGEAGLDWYGADLTKKSEQRTFMLHDDFFESYWDYTK